MVFVDENEMGFETSQDGLEVGRGNVGFGEGKAADE